jgi:membrane-associated protein
MRTTRRAAQADKDHPVTLALNPLDATSLLTALGAVGVFLVLFAETGLLIGFFLPGDSLLFTVGLLVADNKIKQPIELVVVLVCIAAVAGNQVGYLIGRKAGPALFNRHDSRFFKQAYVDKTNEFFDKHGPRAIVLARFVPIVRTFITVVAGVGKMNYRTYTIYSVIGGVLWGMGVTLLGFALGGNAFVRDHIELILIGIVVVSLLPVGFEVFRHRGKTGARADTAADTSTGSGTE